MKRQPLRGGGGGGRPLTRTAGRVVRVGGPRRPRRRRASQHKVGGSSLAPSQSYYSKCTHALRLKSGSRGALPLSRPREPRRRSRSTSSGARPCPRPRARRDGAQEARRLAEPHAEPLRRGGPTGPSGGGGSPSRRWVAVEAVGRRRGGESAPGGGSGESATGGGRGGGASDGGANDDAPETGLCVRCVQRASWQRRGLLGRTVHGSAGPTSAETPRPSPRARGDAGEAAGTAASRGRSPVAGARLRREIAAAPTPDAHGNLNETGTHHSATASSNCSKCPRQPTRNGTLLAGRRSGRKISQRRCC